MTDFNKKLMRALSFREWENALLLLENGANPTVRDKKGYNALLLLADGASVEVDQPILQQLADICLNQGCSLSDTTKDGKTVMHLCATNMGLFTHFLTLNPNCAALTHNNKTVLYFAARNRGMNLGALKTCIALGANIHHKDNHGNTAFDYFSRPCFSSADYLLFFIQQGFCPNKEQIVGGFKVALGEKSSDSAMMSYLAYAHQNGVDFNSADSEQTSLLELAVSSGRFQAVEYMLNNGACVQHSNIRSPIGVFLPNINHQNATQLMNVLVKHGLDVNDAGKHLSQQTMVHQVMYSLPFYPFDAATANDLLVRLRTLLEYGGDLTKPEETGMTPLSLGLCELMDEYPNISQLHPDIQKYVNDVLDLFLEYGCDLNQTVGDGTGKMGLLSQLLRRGEVAELLEYKIAQKQHARILMQVDGTIEQRYRKM